MANHENRSNERVTITDNKSARKERITLPKPHWEGREKLSAGVTLEAIYKGPHTGRMFARYYSVWTKNDGAVEGTSYRELDDQEYLDLCNMACTEPVGLNATEV